MKSSRRDILRLAAGAAALPLVPGLAFAQAYPSRPVRMIVGFAAGSAPDIVARLMGQWLSDQLGQPIVIDNRPGAASNIGTEAAVRSAPDGYTLQMTVLTNVFNATLYKNFNFNFMTDVTQVGGVANAPYVVIVPPTFPAKTDSGVHRLRQGESRQDQHGVGRRRLVVPHLRRVVQDDGRHRDAARAVSRRAT